MSEVESTLQLFTREQANAMLPLVRAIAMDMMSLARDVFARRERLSHLLAGRQHKPGDIYSDELRSMEDSLEADAERLRDYVEELRELGVEAKGVLEGLVDFPSLLEGRVVYLCWKVGEPTVSHWHELEAGFAGRQPLPQISDHENCSSPR